MEMTMNYEFITPEIASRMLEMNGNNRSLSTGTVTAYANDIKDGRWDESVGATISFDEDGILRDGQHRLAAVVKANKGIKVWVCRNTSRTGIYDCNRKRSSSDQISITRPDLEKVYTTSRYVAIASHLIRKEDGDTTLNRRRVAPFEIIEFTDRHKADLDEYFLNMPQHSLPKTSVAAVHIALFLAYLNGVPMNKIEKFYDVLTTGMSTCPEEFPVIAYRNYLVEQQAVRNTDDELARCQYALSKYIEGSCTKRSIVPKKLIYPCTYRKDSK